MIKRTAEISIYDPESRPHETRYVTIQKRGKNDTLVYITVDGEVAHLTSGGTSITVGVAPEDLAAALRAVTG